MVAEWNTGVLENHSLDAVAGTAEGGMSMGIYIKGMEMPKNCWNCPFFHTSLHHIGDDELLERYTCLRTGERTENVTGYMKNCPLIEIPPHGRLIDADAFLAKAKEDPLFPLVERYGMSSVIEAQPTIAPAEGKEADE